MSQIETHIGKFKILTKGRNNILEYIKEHNIEEFFDIDKYHYIESIESGSEYYDILDGDILIEYIEHREYGEDDDLIEFTKNEDGTIDFLVQFYNGGCCLSEALACYKNYVGE